MQVFLNGRRQEIDENVSVEEFLKKLSLDPRLVAVEINENIVKKKDYGVAKLNENDKVEIVHLVGGGMETKSLVIVESPAKANTISKLLGNNYRVSSSMGHIMDLPKERMGVEIEKDFQPQYTIIPGKRKIVSQLKKEAATVNTIYLAPDPDREGEAISWHLFNLLGKDKRVFRVIFHEITRYALVEAFKNPGNIDLKKVDAQIARRILDRIVGYSLSPLLWRKVGRGLSAGRVQSVAVRLIVEREREIKAFVPQEYWEIEAELQKLQTTDFRPETTGHRPEELKFIAKLEKIEGKKPEIKNKQAAEAIVQEIRPLTFIVSDIQKKEKKRFPQAPFTTSKLQQEAFNKLHFPAQKTMRIAQQLYEGLEIGKEGSVGLITYMRTDSVLISDEAMKEVRIYISDNFGKEFLPETPNRYKSKKLAQEAHEAIRPTLPLRRPETLRDFLNSDQLKLYTLIWNKFLASQMNPAIFLNTTVDISATAKFLFRASGSILLFPGFLTIYNLEEEDEEEKPIQIPELTKDEVLKLLDLIPSQHFTKPPSRYTDASLVKALEEYGIGRPSTYAPIIQTIVTRTYVKRQGGYFIPTELGSVVTELLMNSFPKILDLEFTAKMEEELDEIEEGKQEWTNVLHRFYNPFKADLAAANVNMKKIKTEQTPTSEVCNVCGRPMVIKWGRHGRFLSCSGFPKCKNAKPISTGVKCPQEDCDGELIERRAKTGRTFYGCTNYPKCKFLSRRLPKTEEEKENGPLY